MDGRYVRLVEAGVHEALTLTEGAEGGEGGRGARARRPARPPPHLHAALAALPPARPLLASVAPAHYRVLQRRRCASEQEAADAKASLWAVGQAAAAPAGLALLLALSGGAPADSVPAHVLRLAKYCRVYSVRATAFYVLGLIGSTCDGANLLSELGETFTCLVSCA